MRLILTILLSIYNLCILAGTAYLVEVHHWNPAWFALSLLLLMTIDLAERR